MQVFKLGDVVRIKAGPFAGSPGRVEGINQAKALPKVKVEVLGRGTPVGPRYADVGERLRPR